MKKLIAFLKSELGIENESFIEKDIFLHRVLLGLMKTTFKNEYVFKGGTCLVKCYFGYYRFSEDLDFTYINQTQFENISQKKIRRLLSQKIDEVSKLISTISKELNLDFKDEKSNQKYIQMCGSNKFVTFKLWYMSSITGNKEFIKIQINFLELLINKPIEMIAKSLYEKVPRNEIILLNPEYENLTENIKLKAYSLDEIIYEKIRAILTRRGTKSRDYFDIFIIQKNHKIDFDKCELRIIEKVKFMLRYDKYLQNLSVIHPEKLILGEEENMLLDLSYEEFNKFLPGFFEYLKKLEKKVK